jgi:hypothetical protein
MGQSYWPIRTGRPVLVQLVPTTSTIHTTKSKKKSQLLNDNKHRHSVKYIATKRREREGRTKSMKMVETIYYIALHSYQVWPRNN